MFELLFPKTFLLFIFSSPQEWILVISAGFLLFGANRLPELAKSLGQARKEFKKGMLETEEDGRVAEEKIPEPLSVSPAISEIDNAVLLEEFRRREEARRTNLPKTSDSESFQPYRD